MHVQFLLKTLAFTFGLVQAQNTSAPIVDLGYALHQGSAIKGGNYYNFSNIPYAEPPLGDLRFRSPQLPSVNRSVLNDGVVAGTGSTGRDPMETEDCLLLDVVVPKKVFESNSSAPVLVHIHGGGYVVGSKIYFSDPSYLLAKSSDNMIVVGINYRLGALGWLAGPSFQKDGTANAGLLDQRMALEWVQQHIHLFGGDKDQVTVMGESAGAGSIVHHVTAYGGKATVPFQRAIPQSPAWIMTSQSSHYLETTFQDFLSAANVTSLAELRALSSEQLLEANSQAISAAPLGQYIYGPSVDGDLITADAKQLLIHGQFNPNVSLIVGHTESEGYGFVPTNLTDYNAFLSGYFPETAVDVRAYIEDTLYPPVYNTSFYNNTSARASRTVADSIINCNAGALASAYANNSYAYNFAVQPAIHGSDYSYTWYGSVAVANSTIADALQDYIISFITTGKPTTSVSGVPDMEVYGSEAVAINFDTSGIVKTTDIAANERCAWWELSMMV
ncbi:Carboxylesterase [Lasiodiplodia theobromae]|uniref:Carboxylesterase n=1 Tax=Lasiodiplodia theobromae TaxID=45133 RepID=UPI0015C3DBA3|nr:Carboxylesterase [Lasiodiplodia theobromae]KAF4539595.1 Carboxylesterase [Lasiodiplodia theobromae]